MSLFVQRGYSSAGICLSLRRRWETVWPLRRGCQYMVAARFFFLFCWFVNCVTYRPGPPSTKPRGLAGISHLIGSQIVRSASCTLTGTGRIMRAVGRKARRAREGRIVRVERRVKLFGVPREATRGSSRDCFLAFWRWLRLGCRRMQSRY